MNDTNGNELKIGGIYTTGLTGNYALIKITKLSDKGVTFVRFVNSRQTFTKANTCFLFAYSAHIRFTPEVA